MLSAIGLNELVTTDFCEYVDAATALCSDSNHYLGIRNKLKNNMHREALFDTARFTGNLENAFKQILERHEAGKPPQHIDVADCGPSASFQ